MKYVLVIEDDSRFQKEIAEALAKTDPKLNVRFFSSLAPFSEFVAKLIQGGPEVIHGIGFDVEPDNVKFEMDMSGEPELGLLVCKDELLGHTHMDLLKKTRELFIRKKLCSAEAPTNVVLTAFDQEKFRIKDLEEIFINNVIMKPFDGLILQEHLATALLGRKPVKASLVHRMKTKVEVEMIKDVQTESFSDLGFVTRSPREVPVGVVAKYYGDLFSGSKRTHVYAKCWKSEKHPEIPGEFRCWFTYFGSEPQSHAEYRRKLAQMQAPEVFLLKSQGKKSDQVPEALLGLVEPSDQRRKELKHNFESHMPGVKVMEFASWAEFHLMVDPIGYEGHQKEVAWSGDQPMVAIFDLQGKKIQTTEPLLDGKTLFGYTMAELLNLDFLKLIADVSQTEWVKCIVQKRLPVGPDPVLAIRSPRGQFLVKVLSLEEVKDATQVSTGIKVMFTKPNLQDRLAWYQAQSKLQSPLMALVSPQEIIQSIPLDLWTSLRESYQKKWQTELTTLMYAEKNIDESNFRSMRPGILDLFYFQPDLSQIYRKLSLVCDRPFDENFKFFLAKADVRVANPIEIQELSEASLVMKYYRPMSLGSFRKFVLPKATGDKVLEYLGTCNYSEPDPNNKEVHLNYFVFFGITDAFLKNIRVWIRENYAHEKEKAAG